MKALATRLACAVSTAEDHGWRGDSIEAEAIAYLAARTSRGLPISYPKTTGVPAPMIGGGKSYSRNFRLASRQCAYYACNP
jgi:anhydro-N-acetylmuramic acid kinase